MALPLVPHMRAPEQIMVLRDASSGLDGVIAIDSTTLGPAAGGCRLWSYASLESAAADAIRLAEGMSYKDALAGLPLGGGKAVLRRPDGNFDRHRLFRAFGEAVEQARGSYVTAEDVGTSVEDMVSVRGSTRHVAGLPTLGHGPGGDPSPWTARGVFLSVQYVVERLLRKPLVECRVAIQGVGNVGFQLARMLADAGVALVVADVHDGNVERAVRLLGATALPVDAILSEHADVLAPCALGGVLSHPTIGSVGAKIVCGAANNQLEQAEDGARLADRGIFYAPDYVVNAGGIINVAAEYLRWAAADVVRRVDAVPYRLGDVMDQAAAGGQSTNVAADALAHSVIGAAGRLEVA